MNIRNIAIAAFAAMAVSAGAQMQVLFEGPEMTPDRKIIYAQRIIENYYLDDVDGDKIAEEAIAAMLNTLDPHSSYTNPEETREMTQPLDGNFSGIGIQFNMLNDTLFVLQTTAGGPSEKVGILPGDKILSADGEPLSGAKKKNSDIIKKLRGPKGTVVNVDVERRGKSKPVKFRIERDDIPINSVDAVFMVNDSTGYIKLIRFGEQSDREFSEALSRLKVQGMKHLILDLEDNGGGYLGTAVDLAGHFLDKDALVTYTESPKMGQKDFYVKNRGDFADGRLVVMVNQYSASASEILSGAVQDHDRGVIVGRRTFGKGLVQRPFPFPDGSMIKLTVSRYHTPSGRSIQKPYEAGNAEDYRMEIKNRYENGEFSSVDNLHFPDSLKFETLRTHRTVYGGGGIMPDLFVPLDTTAFTDYYRDLVAKGLINRFTIKYVDDHRAMLKKEYPDIKSFIHKFHVIEKMLGELIAMGERDDVKLNREQYELSRPMMTVVIKGLIARNLFNNEAYYRVVNPELNQTYQVALELINHSERYNDLLGNR